MQVDVINYCAQVKETDMYMLTQRKYILSLLKGGFITYMQLMNNS